MTASTAPTKTPAGQAELETRRLRLSQRHRTVLLLVDGRRSEAEVRQLADQAGAASNLFDELLERGLIAVSPSGRRLAPAAAPPQAAVTAVPVAAAEADDRPEAEIQDPALARARDILLRMIKAEAPLTGSLTSLRLRRARSRDELGELLDEVRAHLGSRQRSLASAQSLASVRQLLSPSFDSTQPIA